MPRRAQNRCDGMAIWASFLTVFGFSLGWSVSPAFPRIE